MKSDIFYSLLSLFFLSIFLYVPLQSEGQNILKNDEVSLFDGETLKGWNFLNSKHAEFWGVKDGVIYCGNGEDKIPVNLFLYTDKKYKNFEFRCLFRLTGNPQTGMINSGIQYRSIVEGDKMIGYQADIGDGYWGDLYDEHRRGELADAEVDVLNRILNKNGWNSYVIRCKGDLHELYINGVKTCEYVEKDKSIPDEGVIALQLHSGGKAVIEYRDIVIEEF
ncbi:3-keto-disaccharide hydrolase [Membranihabitans maritimus]|uniref:3-keto-disaccharide hydrolase n=1 Tax=Membranihabitans maritimus TaxID=2904244 RepID=UPI001F488586|nr:DUF1080 domain-containing protein [Membranihabitans maritimus]